VFNSFGSRLAYLEQPRRRNEKLISQAGPLPTFAGTVATAVRIADQRGPIRAASVHTMARRMHAMPAPE
jgi:hypothetical protein